MAKSWTVHYAKSGDREEETFFPQIGRAFETEKRIDVKFDSIPLSHIWDGRIFLYPVREKKDG